MNSNPTLTRSAGGDLDGSRSLDASDRQCTAGLIHISDPLDRFMQSLHRSPIQPIPNPSKDQMRAIEPNVGALLARAAKAHACGYYGHCQGIPFNKSLESTAGWFAANPLLRSSAAYETLQSAILDAFLPGPCLACRCEQCYPEDIEAQERCILEGWE